MYNFYGISLNFMMHDINQVGSHHFPIIFVELSFR